MSCLPSPRLSATSAFILVALCGSVPARAQESSATADAVSLEAALGSRRVTLVLEDAPLDEAVAKLARASGLNLVVHPASLSEGFPVTLRVKDATVRAALQLVLMQANPPPRALPGRRQPEPADRKREGGGSGLEYRLVRNMVLVQPRVPKPGPRDPPEREWFKLDGLNSVVRRAIDENRLTVRFEDAPAYEAVSFVRDRAGVPVVVASAVTADWLTSNSRVNLVARDVSAGGVLEILAALLGVEVRWRQGAVLLRLPEPPAPETATGG